MSGGNTMGGLDSALDRRPWVCPVVLVAVAVVPHLVPVLLGLHVDPIWYFGFIEHGARQGKLPGRMYLDPYVGWTGAVSRVAALEWLHGEVPWWNPLSGIGMPLAGQMQPMAFLLPFILLMALPLGLVWFTIAMQVLSGIATFGLLRRLGVSRLAALAGGAMFGLNGTLAWMPGPAAVGATLAFLPVLLWGIEAARAEDGRAGLWGVALGIAGSLMAGFPETAYLEGLVGLAWAVLRVVQGPAPVRLAWRVGLGGVAGLLLAAPVLLAFADELAGASLVRTHLFGRAFMPRGAAPLLLLPTLFGPPNAVLALVWGNVGGYGGVAALCAALLALTSRAERGLKLLLAGMLLAGFARLAGLQPVTWLINLLPAMKQVAFHRYGEGPMQLVLVVLAGLGLDAARDAGRRGVQAACGAVAMLVAISVGAGVWTVRGLPRGGYYHALPWVMGLTAVAGLGVVVVVAVAGRWRVPVLAGLVAMEALAVFAVGRSAGVKGGRQDAASVQYLQAHAGFARVVSIHPFAPNYPAAFGIAALGHNMSPVPQPWLDHVNRVLLPGLLSVEQGSTFWPTLRAPLDAPSQIRVLRAQPAAFDVVDVGYLLLPPGGTWSGAMFAAPPGLQEAVEMEAGQTVTVVLPPVTHAIRAASAGVLVGTFGDTATGRLRGRLCAGVDCAEGEVALDALRDGQLGMVPLDHVVAVAAGQASRLTLTRADGASNFALWEAPVAAGPPRAARVEGGGAVQAGLAEAPAAGWRLVHQGTAMDIWARDKATGYFDAPGCGVEVASRTDARVRCLQASVLTRRELYLPGWRAAVNGAAVAVRPVENVLQAVAVPAGESVVHFVFAPRGASWAGAGMVAGILILAAGSAKAARRGGGGGAQRVREEPAGFLR